MINLPGVMYGNYKGGYNLTTLKEIGISYFDIEPNNANKMNKKELCDIIIPQVIKETDKIAIAKKEIYPSNN